jgi:hypothetical protein
MELGKAMKIGSHNSRDPCRVLHLGSPKAEVLIT